MEVVDVPGHPGKFDVLFNGRAIECETARDCPVGGLCAMDTPWQLNGTRGICFCNTYFGFAGSNCDQWTYATGYIAAVAVIACVISLINWTGGTYLLVRYTILKRMILDLNKHAEGRQQGPPADPLAKKLHLNPVIISLTFASLGGMFLLIGTAVNLSGIASFPHHAAYVVEANRTLKAIPEPFDIADVVLTALGYCFTVCSAIVLPLTWLDLAMRSMRLRSARVAKGIMLISVAFTLVNLGVELPFYAMTVIDSRSINSVFWYRATAIGWLVIFGSLIVLNVITLTKISIFSAKIESFAGDAAQASTRGVVNRITISSVCILICLVGAMICLGICPLAFSPRRYASDPRVYLDHQENAVRFGRIFVALLGLSCIWFCLAPARGARRTVQDVRRRAFKSPTTASSVPREGKVSPLGMKQVQINSSESGAVHSGALHVARCQRDLHLT